MELGALIGGRYRLDEQIGRGGMASVFRAWDVALERPVAIKILRPEILADPDLALRFRREAHAATVLRHPNVVACLDTGREGDQPYLVMDLVDGEDLTSRLRRDGTLPPAEAVHIATDVARGLAVAHARGIVHRDVKPGNILLGSDGRARVTDFGIARVAAEAEATLPGTTLGSVHYFSPEQAQGVTTTPASDVYSLGLVLFEMLTGTRPFPGDSPAQIALARVGAPAPSARGIVPAVPPALDAILRRALAPDPRDRYPSGGALAAELEGLGRPDPAAATTVVSRGIPAPDLAGRADRASVPGPRTSIVIPVVALAAVLIAVFGGLSIFLLGGNGGGVAALEPTDPGRGSASQPAATQAPTEPAEPSPGPTGAPPSPAPTQAPTLRPDGTADLCDPPPTGVCQLRPGRYVPSRFEPSIEFELADGWATFLHTDEIVVLAHPEGYLALARDIATVYDEGEPLAIRPTAADFVDAVRGNDDLDILDRRRGRFAGYRATQLDIAPEGEDRVPVFGTSEDVYYAETGTATRLVAFEVDGHTVVLVLEGANGFGLDSFLGPALAVLDSLAFR